MQKKERETIVEEEAFDKVEETHFNAVTLSLVHFLLLSFSF